MRKFFHDWRVNRLRDKVIVCGERLRAAQRRDASVDELETLARTHQRAIERFKEANT